jgi:hypothetical protein
MNRHERRAGHAVHKQNIKQALKINSWGDWEDITVEVKTKLCDKPEIARLLNFYKNKIYSAQVIMSKTGPLLGIRRHDQSIDVPWVHKQRIKNEIMGEDAQAVEVFPTQDTLVDGANMYWLWIIRGEFRIFELKEALRGIYD